MRQVRCKKKASLQHKNKLKTNCKAIFLMNEIGKIGCHSYWYCRDILTNKECKKLILIYETNER